MVSPQAAQPSISLRALTNLRQRARIVENRGIIFAAMQHIKRSLGDYVADPAQSADFIRATGACVSAAFGV